MRIGILYRAELSEYTDYILKGVRRFCDSHNLTLYELPVWGINNPSNEYSYQFDMIKSNIDSCNLDGIISVSPILTDGVNPHDLEWFHSLSEKIPVTSISRLPGIPSVQVACREAIYELIHHLVHTHGKKRFAMITGRKKVDEIVQRELLFFDALKENGLSIDAGNIFEGDYSYDYGLNAFINIIKAPEDVTFDVLLGINDEIAYGALVYLSSLNVKIPEDVCVTGFDNSPASQKSYPLMTTIDQKISEQGYTAAELLLKKIRKQKIPELTTIEAKLYLRQSTGYLPLANKALFKSYIKDADRVGDLLDLKRPSDFFREKLDAYYVGGFLNTQFPNEWGKEMRNKLLGAFKTFVSATCICRYKRSIRVHEGDEFIFPEEASVVFGFNEKNGWQCKHEESINPQKQITPAGFDTGNNQVVIVYPIFSEEDQTGYILITPRTCSRSIFYVFLQAACKIINSSFEYTEKIKEAEQLEEKNIKLESSNENLDKLSKTEPLTKFLNRRGFMEYGRQMINVALESNSTGMVIFADMDGLKKINDTYGHDTGDRAIIAESEILRKTFRSSDVIARFGGDEFAIVAVGMTETGFQRIEKYIDFLTNDWNLNSNEDFILSLSMGTVVFSEKDFDLDYLLKEADRKLYDVKRRKKLGIID